MNKSILRDESKSTVYIFVLALFLHVSKHEKSKINFTKVYMAYVDSPCRELSNGGLGIVVALLVRWGINFLSTYSGRVIQL